jgi:hypothetical protein
VCLKIYFIYNFVFIIFFIGDRIAMPAPIAHFCYIIYFSLHYCIIFPFLFPPATPVSDGQSGRSRRETSGHNTTREPSSGVQEMTATEKRRSIRDGAVDLWGTP